MGRPITPAERRQRQVAGAAGGRAHKGKGKYTSVNPLFHVALETSHLDPRGVGWYAYAHGRPDFDKLRPKVEKAVSDDPGGLGMISDQMKIGV